MAILNYFGGTTPMLILCLDSSGHYLKTGLFDNDRWLSESKSDSRGNHSEKIIYEIQHILEVAGKSIGDVHRLAANLGPGSFTGLRIGLAALAGLSLSRHIPLTGFNAFEIMLEDIKNGNGNFLGVIPCRGDEYYAASMASNGRTSNLMGEYQIMSPAEFEIPDKELTLIGSGARRFMEKAPQNLKRMLRLDSEFDKMPSLRSLGHLAADNKIEKPDNLAIPDLFYIAPSQAEVNYARRRAEDHNR